MVLIRWLVVLSLAATACAELSPPTAPPDATSPSNSPTPESTQVLPVKVPKVAGLTLARAKDRLDGAGLRWRVKRKVSDEKPGTVLSQKPRAGRMVKEGTRVTLVVAKAVPATTPPERNCHPSYEGACLLPDASDYDCAGGSGNGPYYTGPVRVVGPDVFDLDRDGDGYGCE